MSTPEARAAGWERAAGVAFLLLVVTLPGPIAPMGIAAGIAAAATLAAMWRAKRFTWPRTPVDLAVIAWLVALALASAFSLQPAASWGAVKKALFGLLVGLAALRARDRATGERVLAVYFGATALVAVIGLDVWIRNGASFEARARGLSGHYMTFAGQLALMLPVAIAVALYDRRARWRWGAGLSAALTLAALAVTFTRSAWIGLAVSLAVIAGAWSPVAVGAVALVAAAVFAFAPGTVGARLRSIFDPHNPWNQQRVYMWDAGLRMFRDHPLTGVGLQDLHALYDRYRSPLATERAGHLHNVFVQIAAQMGAVGLAAFAWLYGSFVRAATAGLRPQLARRGFAAGVRVGVLAMLAGFIVAGLFEWNFGDEELLYGLYTLVGLAWAARSWDTEA